MGKQYAVLVDLLLVMVFATIGRASHSEGLTPSGILSTAWPFLTACLVAWAVMLIRKRDHLGLGAGIFTWLITWAGGLVFRVSSGDTAETASCCCCSWSDGVWSPSSSVADQRAHPTDPLTAASTDPGPVVGVGGVG